MSFSTVFFNLLEQLDSFFWSYIGFLIIVISGIYFTIKSRFFQFRVLKEPRKTLRDLHDYDAHSQGVHPLRLYFASVGGMIGLGNIVGVVSAILLGGPGALFWLWCAGIAGMLIKYCEIYLGIKYREPNAQKSFNGGSIYFLRQAFKSKWPALFVSLLLCIYGVEVFQFVVVTDTLTTNFALNRYLVIGCLLFAVLYVGFGGIKRLADICTILMPIFVVIYVCMCSWIILYNIQHLPELFLIVLKSAFTGHAALGGFVGSTFIVAAQHGIARAVYSGDIAIGYDSIIQSETRSMYPERQARMGIFALATDLIICTMSMVIVLITKLWHQEGMQASEYVAAALSLYFPYINVFMGVLFFLAGFTTIIAYFTVGIKSAEFLLPRYGKMLYIAYAVCAFVFFTFHDQAKVMLIMSFSGGLLMMINLLGIMKLRQEIKFM